MDPEELIGNEALEARFKYLLGSAVQFANDFSGIGPNAFRLYAKRRSAAAAAQEYVSSGAANLRSEGIQHTVVNSDDYQRTAQTNATFRKANDRNLISALNKYLREPSSLLFYRGALFESTVNAETHSYSQVLYMRDLPPAEDIASFSDITLWAKPASGTATFASMENGEIPSEEELLSWNWKKVRVKVARERLVQSNHLEGGRRQYSLRHIGASTINRVMGSTLDQPVAIEVSGRRYCS